MLAARRDSFMSWLGRVQRDFHIEPDGESADALRVPFDNPAGEGSPGTTGGAAVRRD